MTESEGTQTDNLRATYDNLIDLWTSGIRDYHSLLSDYLTANYIFVAALGFLIARQPVTLIFTLLVILLCISGILITLQMAIVLGRFTAQVAVWEWQLRSVEGTTSWNQRKLFTDLHRFRDRHESLEDDRNDPPVLRPKWAIRRYRPWWAHREVSFPLFFGGIYSLFLIWGIAQLF